MFRARVPELQTGKESKKLDVLEMSEEIRREAGIERFFCGEKPYESFLEDEVKHQGVS